MTHHTTKTSYAPIALFLYNRIDHTKAVLNSLALNSLAKETNLYIFSDGPKESSQSETTKINAIRAYVKTFQGCKTTTIIERDTNWGLADNITQGITQVLDQHEKIIVLESDTTPTPYFLNYMNDSLDLYEYDERVMHISGYMFPIATDDLPSTFFYKPTSCWGWATYRRSWNLFISDPLEIWNELNKQKLLDEFNIKYGNFSNQLAENILGLRKTWAIKWYSTVFLNNGLSLHPSHSYISNIGNDGSGTNSKKSNQRQKGLL